MNLWNWQLIAAIHFVSPSHQAQPLQLGDYLIIRKLGEVYWVVFGELHKRWLAARGGWASAIRASQDF